MKKAFTMIELIFVIVIIGILAAVVIPKLSATRDDAKISVEISSLKQVIHNLGMEFITKNDIPDTSYTEANAVVNCFIITKNNNNTDGNFTVKLRGAATTACDAIVLAGSGKLATSLNILGASQAPKVYEFNGVTIVR